MKNIAIFSSRNWTDIPAVFNSTQQNWELFWIWKIKAWIISKSWIGAEEKFNSFWIKSFLFETFKKDKDEVYSNILKKLLEEKIDLVVCIWWMSIFPKSFIDKFSGQILNVHPSYLPWNWPKWKIDDILKEVLFTKKWFWASIHFINEKIDEWEIVLAEEIKVLENDDENSLKEKVQKVEQQLYPKAIKIVLEV